MRIRVLVSLSAILAAMSLFFLSMPPAASEATTLAVTGGIPSANSASCTAIPAAPALISPAAGATVNQGWVVFTWSTVTCATTYAAGVVSGPPWVVAGYSDQLKMPISLFSLMGSAKYYWSAAACNSFGCRFSPPRTLNVAAAPPPTPSPTGTPPPTFDPSRIVNYQGPAVYLNSLSNQLYFADCRDAWWPVNGTVYFGVAKGTFRPYDQVTVTYDEVNLGVTGYYTTLTADANGNTQMTWDSTGWPNSHYHWTFTASSGSYCGHFDKTK